MLNTTQYERAFEKMILRDHLALDRTILANRRTLLAYVRTFIGMLSAGVGMIHFGDQGVYVVLGGALILMGCPVLWLGVRQYTKVQRCLARIKPQSPISPTPCPNHTPREA